MFNSIDLLDNSSVWWDLKYAWKENWEKAGDKKSLRKFRVDQNLRRQ
jgi:hypothetical protein